MVARYACIPVKSHNRRRRPKSDSSAHCLVDFASSKQHLVVLACSPAALHLEIGKLKLKLLRSAKIDLYCRATLLYQNRKELSIVLDKIGAVYCRRRRLGGAFMTLFYGSCLLVAICAHAAFEKVLYASFCLCDTAGIATYKLGHFNSDG